MGANNALERGHEHVMIPCQFCGQPCMGKKGLTTHQRGPTGCKARHAGILPTLGCAGCLFKCLSQEHMQYHVAKVCTYTKLTESNLENPDSCPSAPKEGDPTRRFLHLSPGNIHRPKPARRLIDAVSELEIKFAETMTKANISSVQAQAILKTMRDCRLTAESMSDVSCYTNILEKMKEPGRFMEESLASAVEMVRNTRRHHFIDRQPIHSGLPP